MEFLSRSGGRAFDIIEALVQSAGELATKNDLMGRVRPSAIVEDNTLQFHISAIRKALGPGSWELRAALSFARLRVRQDRQDDARQLLAPVHDTFTEGFETPDLRSAIAMLQSLPSRMIVSAPRVP